MDTYITAWRFLQLLASSVGLELQCAMEQLHHCRKVFRTSWSFKWWWFSAVSFTCKSSVRLASRGADSEPDRQTETVSLDDSLLASGEVRTLIRLCWIISDDMTSCRNHQVCRIVVVVVVVDVAAAVCWYRQKPWSISCHWPSLLTRHFYSRQPEGCSSN